MSGNDYLVLGYVISFMLLWGYAIVLWLTGINLRKRERGRT
jgi:hypothetical protein